jgi:molybdate transport system ATP-binding protein
MIDVDIVLQQGQFSLQAAFATPVQGVTALFGPSGSGKTTLLRAIAGLAKPQRGHIRVGADCYFDSAAQRDVAVEDRRTGMVFQDARLFPHLSVLRNLRYGAQRRRGGTISLDGVVDLLGLGALLGRMPASLSGGEAQRVAIGRALLSAPRLLLLDEPLASLDGARKAEILPYLGALRQSIDLPMLLVTHSLPELLRLADHVVLIDAGRVRSYGPVGDVLQSAAVLPERGTVLDVRLLSTSADASHLGFADGELIAPPVHAAAGSALRVFIPARDVIVAVGDLGPVSISNRFHAVVEAIDAAESGAQLIRCRIGNTALSAQIMAQSASRLALSPGMPVTLLVKAVNLDASHVSMREALP